MIKKDSLGAWWIWILGAAFFFFEYVVRVSPSVMAQQLINDFHITAYALGTLSAFFYYAYIVMQIPVGTLVDRFSVRWLVGSMTLLCAASAFLFAHTHTFGLAELSRLLIGVTGAFAFVGALKLATVWFSPKRFGFLTGTTQALGMLGASVGTGPLAIMIAHQGWRHTLDFLGVLLIILAVLIFVFMRDRPSSTKPVSKQRIKVWQGVGSVLRNPMTWINGIIVGLLYAPTGAFGELWGPLYIHKVYGISPEDAAALISVVFIGWAIGSPVMGWISDYIRRRKIIIVGSAACSLVLICVLLYMPFLPLAVLYVVAFVYGFCNVGVSTCYAVSCEINEPQWSGTSLGFTNMASIIVAAAFQPVIGWLLDLGCHGHLVNGHRIYSVHDFQWSMLALPVCLVVCLVFCCFLKESYGANQTVRLH